jgi:hypothetical protein
LVRLLHLNLEVKEAVAAAVVLAGEGSWSSIWQTKHKKHDRISKAQSSHKLY